MLVFTGDCNGYFIQIEIDNNKKEMTVVLSNTCLYTDKGKYTLSQIVQRKQ